MFAFLSLSPAVFVCVFPGVSRQLADTFPIPRYKHIYNKDFTAVSARDTFSRIVTDRVQASSY